MIDTKRTFDEVMFETIYPQRRIFITQMQVFDHERNELITIAGPRIYARSFEDAEDYLASYDVHYVKVVGILQDDYEGKENWGNGPTNSMDLSYSQQITDFYDNPSPYATKAQQVNKLIKLAVDSKAKVKSNKVSKVDIAENLDEN